MYLSYVYNDEINRKYAYITPKPQVQTRKVGGGMRKAAGGGPCGRKASQVSALTYLFEQRSHFGFETFHSRLLSRWAA